MPAPTELNDVPPSQVSNKVHQLVLTGAREIKCTKQADGNWTISAS
jgi:hypothetical protein